MFQFYWVIHGYSTHHDYFSDMGKSWYIITGIITGIIFGIIP
jgi:hypothetical protein